MLYTSYSFLSIQSRIHCVDIFLVQFIPKNLQCFANTINMKWILKEPSTLFSDDILVRTQYFLRFYQSTIAMFAKCSQAVFAELSVIWYYLSCAWS